MDNALPIGLYKITPQGLKYIRRAFAGEAAAHCVGRNVFYVPGVGDCEARPYHSRCEHYPEAWS